MEDKICPACKNANSNIDELCIKCKFPFNGTEKEKSIHIGKFISEKGVIVDSGDYLARSQKLLFIAAGMYLLGTIIKFSFLLNNPIDLFFNVFVIVVIAGSGALIKKSPLLFLAIPTFLLTFIYVVEYFIDFNMLMKGIIFKLLIFGCLIYSIYIFLKSKAFKNKYNIK